MLFVRSTSLLNHSVLSRLFACDISFFVYIIWFRQNYLIVLSRLLYNYFRKYSVYIPKIRRNLQKNMENLVMETGFTVIIGE